MNDRQQATQDARPSGASIRQRVFGEAKGPRTQGDPFLTPFFETAIEHVWGGVWNRPGLDLKYRSLVVRYDARERIVIVAGRDAQRGERVPARIRSAGGEAKFVPADLSPARSVGELATQSDKWLGGADIRVNTAGLFSFGPTAETNE